MHLELIRCAYLSTETLGWLQTPEFELAVIERPWLADPDGPGGQASVSCIPDGPYRIVPHSSERFSNAYVLDNEHLGVYRYARPEGQTWGRTAILIHSANLASEVEGCLAVGMEHGKLDGSHAVLRSRDAMNRLRELLGRSEHELTIRPTRGTYELNGEAAHGS